MNGPQYRVRLYSLTLLSLVSSCTVLSAVQCLTVAHAVASHRWHNDWCSTVRYQTLDRDLKFYRSLPATEHS